MSDNDGGGGDEDTSLAQRRSRRSRNEKPGRLDAFEKLKKGGKNKYEVKELDNVYDLVDEDTYSRKVNDRLKDDWIIDDDGTGYCETGHELFDDDLLDEGDYGGTSSSRGRNAKAKRKAAAGASKEDRDKDRADFRSVRDMLMNQPAKRKRGDNNASNGESSEAAAASSASDDLLGEMLSELNNQDGNSMMRKSNGVPTGLKLLEKTRLVDKLINSSKIQEDKPFSQQPQKLLAVKKKFTAFKVNNDVVKSEPIYYYDDEGFSSCEPESQNIEEYNSEEITIVKNEKEESPVAKRAKLQQKEPVASSSSKKNGGIEVKSSKPSEVEIVDVKAKPKVELQLQEVDDYEVFRQSDADDQALLNMAMLDFEDKDAINFYWFDIYEEPKNPGVLYLFGKIASKSSHNGFVSCCAIIENVPRCMYLLPRETALNDGADVSLRDVHHEFEAWATKNKISSFRARKAEKKYCFGDDDIPSSSEYLEVLYPGNFPPPPDDFSGNTFSRAFGAHASLLENFLLSKKFRGPSWLKISSPVMITDTMKQQSWCKAEFRCQVGKIQIHPEKDKLPVPPFVVVSLNVSYVSDATSKKDSIIEIAAVVNKTFKTQSTISSGEGLFHDSFCLLSRPPGEVWPFDIDRVLEKGMMKMESERSMLACFLAKLAQYDPDIYIGHDLNLDLLLLQLWNHKVPHWSRIGRLKRTSQTHGGGKNGRMVDTRSALAGRITCDVKISAKELIRARSYDIPSLASQVLGLNEDQISAYTGAELKQLFDTSDGICHLAKWGTSLCILNLRLVNELQVMPLALQITTIAGNTLPRTLMGGRSERNEFLLLHAFYNKNYIVPDKWKKRFVKKEEEAGGGGKDSKDSYVGGLVLDPKKGFYDNCILLMDFNSLYPSIIQEFNICFTTSSTEEQTDEGDRGILPEEIRILVQSRREVKKLMQGANVSADLKKQYDIRQKALKLTANSMYGCLGFKHSRFYAKNLAQMITGKGRDILIKTKDTVEKMGFEVIYGDTDSIMINTNTTEIQKVYQIGNKIKTEINRMYKLLELEIDGIFRFLLLLKKKKYAALIYNVKAGGEIETSMELKGLDMVRRDWAPVAATTARSVLDEIMSEQPLDDKIFKIVNILSEKAVELRAGSVPLKDLLITKQLAKNPEEYRGRQGLYHVEVALRMNQGGKLPKKFKNGDTVPYLFCTDHLPHHPAELMASKLTVKVAKEEEGGGEGSKQEKKEEALVPDAVYYLTQQLHPVVSRICEPIPGLDGARIAEALGLDPTSFRKRRVVDENQNEEDFGIGELTEAEKYRDCERFKFNCVNEQCKREIVLESPLTEENGELVFTLSKCPGCSVSFYDHSAYLSNKVILYMRKFIEIYYKGWFYCEDPACTNRDRAVNLRLERGFLICPCKQGVMVREFTESDLNKRFCYLQYLFDVDKRMADFPPEKVGKIFKDVIMQAKKEHGRLLNVVNKQMTHSSYSEIDLNDLFADIMPKKKNTTKNPE